MNDIVAHSIGECWLKSIKSVIEFGEIFNDEDVEIKEIQGLRVKIMKPEIQDEIIEKFGDKNVIEHTLNKFQKGVIMSNRPFTYGELIYNKNNVDQFEFIVNRLKNKKESKSATISLLDENMVGANLPCLNIIDAKIRDEKLILQFFFRSQNILGRQYANLLALAIIQKELAERLSVGIGFMGGYVASAHIYKYDYKYANGVCNNKNITIKDEFYSNGPKSIRENTNFQE